MSTYAEVLGTTLIQYPYTFTQLQIENPYTNYGSNTDFVNIFPFTDTATKCGFTLVPVTILPQPTFDPLNQLCVENTTPTLVNGIWELGWTVAPMSTIQAATAKYNNAITSGVTINSNSNPSINATYSLTSTQIQNLSYISAYITVNSKFPANQTTFTWPDITGNTHTFSNTSLFQEFATAVADYVTSLDLNISITLPLIIS